jgi:phosphatidylglycerol:prolipoprotein diacylglycerol transferase
VFPTLFRIGPVAVHSYGTLLMVGFIAGILLARREARRLRLPETVALDLGVWLLVAGVVGARAMYVALNWGDFAARPAEIPCIWREGGLSFHGGLLGGVIAGLLFAWRSGLPFLSLADMAAPGLALGYGIARFGCLLNGCCYGAPTDLWWGIRFPLYPDSQIATEPSHPTQVYSALGSFCILAVLLWARTRRPVRGQLFLLYLMLYSVLRSGVEVLRKGYTAQVLFDGITQAQAASALAFALALAAYAWLGTAAKELVTDREGGSLP